MCMKAMFFFFFLSAPQPPLAPLQPCSFRLAQTKEALLSQCLRSFSPAHFISSLHSRTLLESTHVCAAYVCACVCFTEFVVLVGVYVCWGSRIRGGGGRHGCETLLWKRLWAVRSTTGDSGEGFLIATLRHSRGPSCVFHTSMAACATKQLVS